MPEFYIYSGKKYFFPEFFEGGGGCSLLPVSYAYTLMLLSVP